MMIRQRNKLEYELGTLILSISIYESDPNSKTLSPSHPSRKMTEDENVKRERVERYGYDDVE